MRGIGQRKRIYTHSTVIRGILLLYGNGTTIHGICQRTRAARRGGERRTVNVLRPRPFLGVKVEDGVRRLDVGSRGMNGERVLGRNVDGERMVWTQGIFLRDRTPRYGSRVCVVLLLSIVIGSTGCVNCCRVHEWYMILVG